MVRVIIFHTFIFYIVMYGKNIFKEKNAVIRGTVHAPVRVDIREKPGSGNVTKRVFIMMSALYSGTTGLKSHATGMSVISDNIANTSTVAYKQSSILYSDLMSQYLTGSASPGVAVSQLGSGATVSSVRTIFNQGGFETGNSVTDLAINGTGFFAVTDGSVTEYTRAGNFNFTSTGALVDGSGWNLTGYKITNGATASSVSPIVIDTASATGVGRMDGQGTSSITAIAQLGGLENLASDAANPYFALASSWNGANGTPLVSGQYGFQQEIQFYDNNGDLQSADIYYDLAASDNGQTVVEFVVGMDPSLDGSDLAGTNAAGLLMAGTLTFSSSGELLNMTAFTPSSGDPTDLTSWVPAEVVNGSPAFTVTVAGSGTQTVGLDMGVTLGKSAASDFSSAAAASADPSSFYGVNSSVTATGVTTTFYGDAPDGVSVSMDGYATGYLQDLTVKSDGTIRGNYSNGQSQDLYQIPLYRFTSEDGLESTAHNHYAATTASGAAQEGVAGTENFGTIAECALEQSNVDLSTEFTNMIITQRGFQMNSKVISTCDQLLQKALEIKR